MLQNCSVASTTDATAGECQEDFAELDHLYDKLTPLHAFLQLLESIQFAKRSMQLVETTKPLHTFNPLIMYMYTGHGLSMTPSS